MEEVWKQVTTPVFWICTVAASMLVSIAMHFFLRMLDRWFGAWNKTRKERQETESLDFEINLHAFFERAEFRSLLIARGSILRFRASIFLMWSAVLYILAAIMAFSKPVNFAYPNLSKPIFYGLMLIVILCFIRGFKILRESLALAKVVNAAYKIERMHFTEAKENRKTSEVKTDFY